MSPTNGANRLADGGSVGEELYTRSPPGHTEEVATITGSTWSGALLSDTPVVDRNTRPASAPPILSDSPAQEVSSPILPGAGRGRPLTWRAEIQETLSQTLETQREELEVMNEKLRQELEEKAAEHERKEKQYKKDISEDKKAYQSLEENLRTVKEENKSIHKEKDELNKRLSKLSNCKAYVSVLKLGNTDLERQVQELKKKNDKLKMVAGVAFKKHKEAWNTKNQLEANLAASVDKLNQLMSTLAHKERELEQSQDSLSGAQQELEEYYPLQNSLAEHQREVEQLQGKLSQIKDIHQGECSNLQQTIRQRERLLTATLGAFQMEEEQTLDFEGFSSSDESSYADFLGLVREHPQLSELVRRLAQNKRINKKEFFSITFSSHEGRQVYGSTTEMGIPAAAAMVSSQEWEPNNNNDTYPGESCGDYLEQGSSPQVVATHSGQRLENNGSSPSAHAEPRPHTQTWESLHKSTYGALNRSDRSLQSKIKGKLQKNQKVANKKNLLSALAEELNRRRVAVPGWLEVHEQTSWSGELVQYAIFRLNVNPGIRAPCSFLGLLKVDTFAYFYVLVSIVAGKLDRPVNCMRHHLQGAQVPKGDIFKLTDKPCQMAHADFCLWYLNPASPALTSGKIMSFIRVLQPGAPEYQKVLVAYIKKRFMNPSPSIMKASSLDASKRNLLSEIAGLFNASKISLSPELEKLRLGGSWDLRIISKLLELEGVTLELGESGGKSNVFREIQIAAESPDLEVYKSALQRSLEAFHKKNMSRYVESHPDWRLKPIDGTTVAEGLVTTPKYLLSCIFYLGFQSLNRVQVIRQINPVLSLITAPVVSNDLKLISRQMLTLMLSFYSTQWNNTFLKRVKNLFIHLFPDVAAMSDSSQVEGLRQTLPAITWKDQSVTTACAADTEISSSFRKRAGSAKSEAPKRKRKKIATAQRKIHSRRGKKKKRSTPAVATKLTLFDFTSGSD